MARQKNRNLISILALLVATVTWLIFDLEQPSRKVSGQVFKNIEQGIY